MSSTVGSPTKTGWKRRSSAASFSMCLRYSSSVVAPMHVQLAAGQHRLQHVGGVHRALGRARADHGVQLVDEEDDLALGVRDLLEHRLQPLLELAAVLRARDERAHVERDDPLVASAPRARRRATIRCASPSTMAVLPTPGSPISTGLFLVRRDSTWIDAADLLVAADHRVELALSRRARSGRARTARAPGTCPRGSGR